jgi:chitodextrinase
VIGPGLAAAGSGFTARTSTAPLIEDKVVPTSGPYSASGTFGSSVNWRAAVVILRTDSEAPTAPSNLSASAVSSSQINLSWTPSTDIGGVAEYRVERCQGTGCSTFSQIGTSPTSTFSDTGRAASTSYSYRVRAADGAPNLSGYSNTASATTSGGGGDTQAPSTPTGLTATAASSTQINLSWTASTDNVGVTGYEVQRCQGAGCTSFAAIGTPAGTTFNDTGRSPGTTYRYQVRARDAVPNWSAASSIATATTQAPADTQAPTTPTGFVLVAASSNEIDLAWDASTDNVGVTAYIVERCQGVGCTSWSSVGTPTATKFNDTSRSPSTAYRYRVSARDAATNVSPPTAIISYTTPASSPDCD